MVDTSTTAGGGDASIGGESVLPQSPLDPILIATGLALLGPLLAIVLSIPVLVVDMYVGLPLLALLALALVSGQYLAFGGLALGYLRSRGLDLGGIRSYLGISRPGIREFVVIIGGWVLIFALLLVMSFLVQLLGTEPAPNESAVQAFENPGIIPPLIVAMFLIVGPSEEILFRGVVQGRLREYFGPVLSIGYASAVFAAIHFLALTGGGTARLLTIAILFVPSLVFGAVYEYTDNLAVPALLHGLHNSVLLALLYVLAVYGPETEELAGQTILLAVLP